MAQNQAIRRIKADMKELNFQKSPNYHAFPLEDNMFEWHFTIRGPPNTEFCDGIYHGRIILPAEYPFKPPNFIFLTPNGRFQCNQKICLSFTSYHQELWQPAWGIRTMLEAIISFLPTPVDGAIGGLERSKEERIRLAKESHNFVCNVCHYCHADFIRDNNLTFSFNEKNEEGNNQEEKTEEEVVKVEKIEEIIEEKIDENIIDKEIIEEINTNYIQDNIESTELDENQTNLNSNNNLEANFSSQINISDSESDSVKSISSTTQTTTPYSPLKLNNINNIEIDSESINLSSQENKDNTEVKSPVSNQPTTAEQNQPQQQAAPEPQPIPAQQQPAPFQLGRLDIQINGINNIKTSDDIVDESISFFATILLIAISYFICKYYCLDFFLAL